MPKTSRLSPRPTFATPPTPAFSWTLCGLLMDAVRCMVREVVRACARRHVGGWRQHAHQVARAKRLARWVGTAKMRRRRPEAVGEYVAHCRMLADRTAESVHRLVRAGRLRRRGQAGPALAEPCGAAGGSGGAATADGGEDPSRREGVLGVRDAHALGIEGQGGQPGGTGRAGVRRRGPVSVQARLVGVVAGGGCARGRPWRPFTLRVESAAPAPWARAALVVVSASCVIVPPFKLKALAAMLAPAGARSAACTV